MPPRLANNLSARRARAGALPLTLAAVLALSGCDWLVSAPEARARELLEVLIHEPQDRVRIMTLANLGEEKQLPALYAAEVDIKLTYLRARARQGASIGVTIKGVDHTRPDERRVQLEIGVREPRTGIELRGTRSDVARVDVVLDRSAADGWRVREIRPVK